MHVDDYRLADCKLFRRPPIDVSVVSKTIEKVIVDAWRTGCSAQNAVDSVLSNADVIDVLSNQIATAVEFQREHVVKDAEARFQEQIDRYREERQMRIDQVKESVSRKLDETQAHLQSLQSQVEGDRSTYSAAQASLEEMRRRVLARLDEVGGKENMERLVKINEALGTPYQPPTPTGQQTPGYVSEQPASGIWGPQQSLEKKLESGAQPQSPLSTPVKKKGKVRRFIGKIWKVMNYKIW